MTEWKRVLSNLLEKRRQIVNICKKNQDFLYNYKYIDSYLNNPSFSLLLFMFSVEEQGERQFEVHNSQYSLIQQIKLSNMNIWIIPNNLWILSCIILVRVRVGVGVGWAGPRGINSNIKVYCIQQHKVNKVYKGKVSKVEKEVGEGKKREPKRVMNIMWELRGAQGKRKKG